MIGNREKVCTFSGIKTKQNKTKQNKTKQNKTKQQQQQQQYTNAHWGLSL